jgi:dienelactone hydrolase
MFKPLNRWDGLFAVLMVALWFGVTRTADSAGPQDIDKRIAPFFQPPEQYAKDFGKFKSPLVFNDGTPVKTPADWQKRRQEIHKFWTDTLGTPPPVIAKPRIEYLDKERRDNVTQHRVRIEIAPDRFTDDAYLLVPDGDGPFPAVVVVFYEAKTGIGRGKNKMLDFAWQLAKRGYVTLSVGSPPQTYYPSKEHVQLQPLAYHAYVAANCRNILANLKMVDARLIGILGHSYGGKWTMFASCLYDGFACAVWCDPGIVFDETNSNVNYWEPWYIGFDPKSKRTPGVPSAKNPRTGPYKMLTESGRDLHELHALMAPRPFLVSGGSEDGVKRWAALNHTVAVNRLLGYENRIAMTNRKGHTPTEESNEQMFLFFDHFLKNKQVLKGASK